MTNCTACGKGKLLRRVPEPKHVEIVGSVKVIDGTAKVLQCASCGQCELSAHELAGYEQRAAALVLREGAKKKLTGEVVRYARKALGLKQTELASLLGVHSETVSRWETKTSAPAIEPSTQLAIVALLDGVQCHGLEIHDLLRKINAPQRAGSSPLEVKEPRRAAG